MESQIDVVKRGVDELSQSILKIKKQIISYTKLDSDERQQVRS